VGPVDLALFYAKFRAYLVEKTQPLRWTRTSKWQVLLSGFSDQPVDNEIDYLVRFEHLQENFDQVCDLLGIPKCKLPSYNASKRSHYSEYYDDELIDLVASKFKMEIRWGDYRFENERILSDG